MARTTTPRKRSRWIKPFTGRRWPKRGYMPVNLQGTVMVAGVERPVEDLFGEDVVGLLPVFRSKRAYHEHMGKDAPYTVVELDPPGHEG